ncbi:MAR-binding filament-like protein 1 [Nicotiana sylvestris]|uniref:MAR-binding filament-like protein 1 n=1 Tax=Nicotiana sylvestris TaxID=4096 RepID=UPI00388C4E82
MEKNFRSKKILVCGIGPEEYNRISICDIAKEIWEALQTAHEGTTQQEFSKYNPEKVAKRNPVPLKDFKRKRSAHNVVKHALAAWGDSSSESEDETDVGDSSMMVVESKENEYDSTSVLMAQSDDDEDKDNKKETICELKREKDVLITRIANLEHERDDLVAVVLDHKETIKNFSEENEALAKRVTEIKEEKDDLLVEIADLKETIKGLRTKSKPGNTGKGKEIASEEHIRLENELKAMRTRMCVETDKNKHLQTELEKGTVKGSGQ